MYRRKTKEIKMISDYYSYTVLKAIAFTTIGDCFNVEGFVLDTSEVKDLRE